MINGLILIAITVGLPVSINIKRSGSKFIVIRSLNGHDLQLSNDVNDSVIAATCIAMKRIAD